MIYFLHLGDHLYFFRGSGSLLQSIMYTIPGIPSHFRSSSAVTEGGSGGSSKRSSRSAQMPPCSSPSFCIGS